MITNANMPMHLGSQEDAVRYFEFVLTALAYHTEDDSVTIPSLYMVNLKQRIPCSTCSYANEQTEDESLGLPNNSDKL